MVPANTETNTKHCPAHSVGEWEQIQNQMRNTETQKWRQIQKHTVILHSSGEWKYRKFSADHNIAGSPSNTEYIILHHPTAQAVCITWNLVKQRNEQICEENFLFLLQNL